MREQTAKLNELAPPSTEVRREHEITGQLLAEREEKMLLAARLSPPAYVVKELGARPADPEKAKVWDRGVRGIEPYRNERASRTKTAPSPWKMPSEEDPNSAVADFSKLLAALAAHTDSQLGVCSIPVYDFDPNELEVIHRGSAMDEIKETLRRHDILQYFFPPQTRRPSGSSTAGGIHSTPSKRWPNSHPRSATHTGRQRSRPPSSYPS